ncbi:MAG TPA: nitrite reductase small subunit NirD [Acidimicrobiia bacterium]|nr:nitrite reductase small subunit NirD [Acidimicrobiia bacterium]
MTEWVEACAYESIYPDTGVCALVGGRQVAVFRLADGTLHALSNNDPFSGANVLSRGIVGDRAGEPKVASPIYKQTFNLRTGVCYEDGSVRLDVFRVRRRSGVVEVFATPVDPSAKPELDDETLDGLGYSRA